MQIDGPLLKLTIFVFLRPLRRQPPESSHIDFFSTDCNSSIFFLIAFIFTWVPPDLQAAVGRCHPSVLTGRWGVGRKREGGVMPLSTPSWCVRLITQPSDPEVTSSTESLTFHGRCKSIHLCQASATNLAFPELAYWSERNAWVRTSCFPLLRMGVVSPSKFTAAGPKLLLITDAPHVKGFRETLIALHWVPSLLQSC